MLSKKFLTAAATDPVVGNGKQTGLQRGNRPINRQPLHRVAIWIKKIEGPTKSKQAIKPFIVLSTSTHQPFISSSCVHHCVKQYSKRQRKLYERTTQATKQASKPATKQASQQTSQQTTQASNYPNNQTNPSTTFIIFSSSVPLPLNPRDHQNASNQQPTPSQSLPLALPMPTFASTAGPLPA